MNNFIKEFNTVNCCSATVILKHVLFDSQTCHCEELHIINDDTKIGVVLKNQEIYIHKQEITALEHSNNVYTLSDGRLTITIIINNL